MANSKLRLAQGLAIAATIAILINTFAGLPPTPVRLLFAVTGVLLAAAAFGVSWGQKSVLISALLLISGTLVTVNGTTHRSNSWPGTTCLGDCKELEYSNENQN
jgi:biotin transporter BioY